MDEKIYTIPLNEAFDQDTECPFCSLYRKLEQKKLEYFLGAAMMEPDVRITTNEKGFCQKHLFLLEKMPNTLSLALVLDTHLSRVVDDLTTYKKMVDTPFKKRFFQKETDDEKNVEKLTHMLNQTIEKCAVCDAICETMDRYQDTFFYLYQTEEEFRKKFEAGKGFCLPHFTHLLESCIRYLKSDMRAAFIKTLYDMELTHLTRINDEIHYYTKKFDYQYQNADWKNSKDAPRRTVEKLVGYEERRKDHGKSHSAK